MGGKVKSGGTAYEISPAKVKVGGTGYSILYGMTKVGGTGYRISFSPIPAEYQQIEYIYYSSGTGYPYIILPFAAVSNMKFEFEGGRPSGVAESSSTTYFTYIGYMATSGYARTYTRFYHAGSNSTRVQGYSSTRGTYVSTTQLTADTLYNVSVSFGPNRTTSGTTSVTFNGTTATSSASTSGSNYTGTGLLLGRLNTSSTSNTYRGYGLYGRFTAYDGSNNVLGDLYPCYRKSDNAVGMYDIVSEQFLTSEVSADFSAGPDV